MNTKDLFITPQTFIDLYEPNLLTIKSTDDARNPDTKASRETKYGADSGFDIHEIGQRYEPDTRRLYISTKWLKSIEALDLLDPLTYVRELQRCSQYRGQLTTYLLKGTGHKLPATTCLVFDMSVACAVSAKSRNKTENFKTWLRDSNADPEYLNSVAPLLDRAKTLRNEIKDHTIDKESAEYILNALRKERKLLERIKFGKATDARKLIMDKRVERVKKKEKLPVLAYAKKLDASNNLMVRQIVQDIHERTGHKEIIIDAEGTVLGLFKDTKKEKKLYLVVSELKKELRYYRRDYRYTHSQTTYLNVIRDGHLDHVNLYCAVFDLRRVWEGEDV